MGRTPAIVPMVVGYRSGISDSDHSFRGPAPHTTYEVMCGTATVLRRHSSFEDLHILLEMRGVRGLLPVPAKGFVVFRRMLPEKRAALVDALNTFLTAVIAADPLLNMNEVRIFLGLAPRSKASRGPRRVLRYLSVVQESQMESDVHETEMRNEDGDEFG